MLVICLNFLFVPGSVLEGYTFVRICPFLPSCPFYYHIVKKEIKIHIETNENENTTVQNLWDSVKAVLTRRFIAIQAHLKKQEKSQINNLTLHLKQLEKEEMKNARVSRRKEIIKIRAEISENETKRLQQKSTKLKGGSLRR